MVHDERRGVRVMRTHTRIGQRRAGPMAAIGILAGLLLPFVAWGYLIVGGMIADGVLGDSKRDEGYDWTSQPMSDLGDHIDEVARWFTNVQVITAVLLVLFANACRQRILGMGKSALAIVGAAVPTLGLAASRCTELNEAGSYDCGGSWSARLHATSAVVIVFAILVAQWQASRHVSPGSPYARLRPISRVLYWITGGLTILFVVSTRAVLSDPIGDAVGWISFSNWSLDLTEYQGITERLIWVGGYTWLFVVSAMMVARLWGVPKPSFDVGHVQDGVLYGSSRWNRMQLLGVTLDDPGAFRAWLSEALEDGLIRPEQPRPRPIPDEPAHSVTVLFTSEGLRRLGQSYQWQSPSIEDAFSIGAAGRAAHVGDHGPSHPKTWKGGWEPDTLHVVIWLKVANDKADDLRKRIGTAGQSQYPHVLADCSPITQDGRTIEHFGFADGVSTTWVDQIHPTHDTRRMAGGKFVGESLEPVALGEFVLGELDESDDVFPVPEPRDFYDRGTFVVLRKLEQDVAGFREFCESFRGGDWKYAAEKLVGRRMDGAPIATGRFGEGPNDFRYDDDIEGYGCPVTSHIRRANPRDSLGFDGHMVHRHRILRRGMTYGAPYREGDADKDRGLMFIAVNVRIAEQFEFIQRLWLNDGLAFGRGTNPDAVSGSWSEEPRTVSTPGHPTVVRPIEEPLVQTRGAAYTFAPSMRALHLLATGRNLATG